MNLTVPRNPTTGIWNCLTPRMAGAISRLAHTGERYKSTDY